MHFELELNWKVVDRCNSAAMFKERKTGLRDRTQAPPWVDLVSLAIQLVTTQLG